MIRVVVFQGGPQGWREIVDFRMVKCRDRLVDCTFFRRSSVINDLDSSHE